MQPDEMMLVGNISALILSVIGAWFAIVKFIKPFLKRVSFWLTTWEQFMIDWAGEEARPGRDKVPGVMERLNSIDGELKHNGGGSIKDSVDRIEDSLNKIDKRLEEGDSRFDLIEKRLANLEKKF